ncbi:unnamed protein product [Brachionus calyciflorus]|uniref:Pesticin C-terminal domain-containing protein n=1 Tax=Brachionus calyciflorus TaxID=104777 RepID=A0A814BN05_9BILA|nr:unnamed protein product [Brachionus calyciflorus]
MKIIGFLSLLVIVSADLRYDETLNHFKNREGFYTTGYLPSPYSGVTIGIGINLGFQSKTNLISKAVPQSIIDKLDKYLGLKQKTQLDSLGLNPSDLVLTTTEAEELSRAFIIDSFNYALQFSQNLNDKGLATLAYLKYRVGSLNCLKCKLSATINGVDTNLLWSAIKDNNATNL